MATFGAPTIFAITIIVLVGLAGGAFWRGRVENRPYAVPLLLLSVLPSFLILGLMYLFRNRSTAPTPLVGFMYLFGVVLAIPVALLEAALEGMVFPKTPVPEAPSMTRQFLLAAALAFGIVAFLEESLKMILVWARARRADVFCTEYGILVLALAGSLGFATLENASYVLSTQSTVDVAFLTVLIRGCLSVPVHAVCGILIGEGVARMLRHPQSFACGRCGAALTVFLPPWLLHGTYDWLLMAPDTLTPNNPTLTMAGFILAGAVVIVGLGLARWRIVALLRRSKGEEPECKASEWPSLEAFEESTTCLG